MHKDDRLLYVGLGSLQVIAVATLVWVGACSPAANRQAINTVLDVAQTTCVLTHADTVDDDAVRKACAITNDLAPVVRDLLGAARAAKVAGAKADAGCK